MNKERLHLPIGADAADVITVASTNNKPSTGNQKIDTIYTDQGGNEHFVRTITDQNGNKISVRGSTYFPGRGWFPDNE